MSEPRRIYRYDGDWHVPTAPATGPEQAAEAGRRAPPVVSSTLTHELAEGSLADWLFSGLLARMLALA